MELNIISCRAPGLPDKTEVLIAWIRGTNVIETRVQELAKEKATFKKEKFSMKTQLDYDTEKQVFLPKTVSTQIYIYKF